MRMPAVLPALTLGLFAGLRQSLLWPTIAVVTPTVAYYGTYRAMHGREFATIVVMARTSTHKVY